MQRPYEGCTTMETVGLFVCLMCESLHEGSTNVCKRTNLPRVGCCPQDPVLICHQGVVSELWHAQLT